jgi:transcriptional regulator with GAF, ATPase, and Fis domain
MVTKQLCDTLVELADTLGQNFDTSVYLQTLTDRSVQLMDITAAGALLADDHGTLCGSAASSQEAFLLQQSQTHTGHGPSLECLRTGRNVDADNLPTDDRWPDFTIGAADASYSAVHTVAIRHRAQTVGALSFFTTRPGPLDLRSRNTGQALSDIAAIGLLQRDGIRSVEILAVQLQVALDSRVLIEQAKGILAERLGLSVSDAFDLMRQYARSHNRRLREVAHDIVDDTPVLTPQVTGPPNAPPTADNAPPSTRPTIPAPLTNRARRAR